MDGTAEAILERWRALFAGDVSEMKHEEIEVYLSGYVDGELTAQEMQRLGIYVETCLACNTLVEDLRQVIAILDLKMPGMDGQELLKILKRAHKYLEVIILTGRGSFDSAVECTKLGAFGYLSKPYELDKLIDVLKQAYEARLKRKFANDQARLKQIADATSQLAPKVIMEKKRNQLAEQPTALSILRALRKLDDDKK